MNNIYSQMRLIELIEALEALGDAKVTGLDFSIHSDRGFYSRNAVAPTDQVFEATELARLYRDQEGKIMTGWKGGEFPVKLDEYIYVAEYGSMGPAVCGLFERYDGTYVPLLVLVSSW